MRMVVVMIVIMIVAMVAVMVVVMGMRVRRICHTTAAVFTHGILAL